MKVPPLRNGLLFCISMGGDGIAELGFLYLVDFLIMTSMAFRGGEQS